jgi:hypothetical protein
MQIKLPDVDLRTERDGSISIQDERGNEVGRYLFFQGSGRTVILFGKYRCSYKTQHECQAFVDGVVAVLNRVTSLDPDRILK